MFLALGLGWVMNSGENRNPSSLEDYELQIQSLNFDNGSRLHALNNVFLRATFGEQFAFEFGRNQPLTIERGSNRNLAFALDIDRSWIKNDELAFKVEIVQRGIIESVLVRCAQISKSVSEYNRSYQCSIPGENAPLLTYRLGKKGSTAPVSVASAH